MKRYRKLALLLTLCLALLLPGLAAMASVDGEQPQSPVIALGALEVEASEDGSGLLLNLRQIAERFGVERASLFVAPDGLNYALVEEAEDGDGFVRLPSAEDGRGLYVRIDGNNRVLWIGRLADGALRPELWYAEEELADGADASYCVRFAGLPEGVEPRIRIEYVDVGAPPTTIAKGVDGDSYTFRIERDAYMYISKEEPVLVDGSYRSAEITLWAGRLSVPERGVKLTFTEEALPVQTNAEVTSLTVQQATDAPVAETAAPDPTATSTPLPTVSPAPTQAAFDVRLPDWEQVYDGKPKDVDAHVREANGDLDEGVRLRYVIEPVEALPEGGEAPLTTKAPMSTDFQPVGDNLTLPTEAGEYLVHVLAEKEGVRFTYADENSEEEDGQEEAAPAEDALSKVVKIIVGPAQGTDGVSAGSQEKEKANAQSVLFPPHGTFRLTIAPAKVGVVLGAAQVVEDGVEGAPEYSGEEQELTARVSIASLSDDCDCGLLLRALAQDTGKEQSETSDGAAAAQGEAPDGGAGDGANEKSFELVTESAGEDQRREAVERLEALVGQPPEALALRLPEGAAEGLEPWQSTVSVTGRDAGDYLLSEQAGQVPEANRSLLQAALGENFEVSVDWQEGAALRIAKRRVQIPVQGVAAVYEPGRELKLDAVAIPEELKNVFFSGGISGAADQLLSEAGALEVPLRYGETQSQGDFLTNYEPEPVGNVLVMFPQSIDSADAAWDEGAVGDLDSYKGKARDELPAYYIGMTVTLESDSAVYDGNVREVAVRFRDKDGNDVALERGADYELIYSLNGQERDEILDAGEYTVTVRGKGSFRGEVALTYTVEKQTLAPDALRVALSGWDYDGQPAGSDAHPVAANPDGARFVYFDADGRQLDEPPVDAGSYSVQAVWESDNRERAESEPVPFEIARRRVTVHLLDGALQEIDDGGAGLYTQEMFDSGEGGDNFDVALDEKTTRPPVSIEGWAYDGQAAGSDAHPVETNPDGGAPHFYSDADMAKEIDPPSDAGTYYLAASWAQEDGGTKLSPAISFTIAPLEVSLEAQDAEITFGDPDPALELIVRTGAGGEVSDAVAGEVRGLWHAVCDHEDAASEQGYEITVDGEAGEQRGSYLLKDVTPGALVIHPRELSADDAEVSGDGLVLRVNGAELVEGADYELEAGDASSNRVRIWTVRGKGNYAGEFTKEIDVGMLRLLTTQGLPWLILTVVLLIGAAVSIVLAARLSKRVKRESFKLLDRVSRQSNRTIRGDR